MKPEFLKIKMICKHCKKVNPFCYLAPVKIDETESICVCLECAKAKGFINSDTGNLKEGHSL